MTTEGGPVFDDTAQLEHSEKILCNVHDPAKCAGRPCTIHNRSDHSMREFKQHWRSDRGIMERLCPHGVGHPDPDSPWSIDSFEWVHGCDGCCAVTDVTPFGVADLPEHLHTGDMSSNTFQVGTVYGANGGRMSFEVISPHGKVRDGLESSGRGHPCRRHHFRGCREGYASRPLQHGTVHLSGSAAMMKTDLSGYRVSHETEVPVLMDSHGPLLVQAGGLYYKRIEADVWKHVSKFTANRMIRKAIRDRYRDSRD